jgi:hypothetical protein
VCFATDPQKRKQNALLRLWPYAFLQINSEQLLS